MKVQVNIEVNNLKFNGTMDVMMEGGHKIADVVDLKGSYKGNGFKMDRMFISWDKSVNESDILLDGVADHIKFGLREEMFKDDVFQPTLKLKNHKSRWESRLIGRETMTLEEMLG